ncbi:hypothetical protein ACOMHN_032428 [Nucella lapillus]
MFCGCVGYVEDGASSNLPLVIVMHVPAVLSLLCVANKTLSTWRLRLSGDIEENPGPDLDPNDRGRHEVKASRPSDEANCASGGGGFHRETRAGADQPLHSGSDGKRGSHSSDAGLSLTGLSSQGVGIGETESPRRDATGQRGDPLASQPARGGGRGDGASCRRDITGQPGGARGGRRNSAGRQAGLRGYLSNQTGGVSNDYPLRNKKAK